MNMVMMIMNIGIIICCIYKLVVCLRRLAPALSNGKVKALQTQFKSLKRTFLAKPWC